MSKFIAVVLCGASLLACCGAGRAKPKARVSQLAKAAPPVIYFDAGSCDPLQAHSSDMLLIPGTNCGMVTY